MGAPSSKSSWPENAIGMRESTKLIINDEGHTIQYITRIYRMKDGTERKIVTTEEL